MGGHYISDDGKEYEILDLAGSKEMLGERLTRITKNDIGQYDDWAIGLDPSAFNETKYDQDDVDKVLSNQEWLWDDSKNMYVKDLGTTHQVSKTPRLFINKDRDVKRVLKQYGWKFDDKRNLWQHSFIVMRPNIIEMLAKNYSDLVKEFKLNGQPFPIVIYKNVSGSKMLGDSGQVFELACKDAKINAIYVDYVKDVWDMNRETKQKIFRSKFMGMRYGAIRQILWVGGYK